MNLCLVDGIVLACKRKIGGFQSPTRCWDNIIKMMIGMIFESEHIRIATFMRSKEKELRIYGRWWSCKVLYVDGAFIWS